jgi:ATP-dependent DNA ligase
MNLDIDTKKLTRKKGEYYIGEASQLADGSLHTRSQEYKRQLSGRMRAVASQEIGRINATRGYTVTRKYDGEFSLVFFDGDRLLSVNPGGTVRLGLPCYEECARLLRAAKVKSCILAGEAYIQTGESKALRIHQVVSILRNPRSEQEMEKLGLAIFDIVEFNGESVKGRKKVFQLLDKWFGDGKLVHPVQHEPATKTDTVLELFTEWVVGQGSEGIVLQNDEAPWYKVKLRHSLDVVVIGYSEGTDQRKGMLHDLLVAVMRTDGTFHELTRVGGGFTDEQRKEIAGDLKRRVVPSDYVAVNNDYVAYEMVQPGIVIEINCLDLITESARGGPVNRMVLKWDKKRYTALTRMPLASVISPQFVRIRDDKDAVPEDVPIRQLSEIVEISAAEKPAEDTSSAPSEILERKVYTKLMKGNTMVRKLLLIKTNKDDKPEFPPYVVHLTDFSPNRQEPLQRDIRIAQTEAIARQHFDKLAEENFIGGWEKADGKTKTAKR